MGAEDFLAHEVLSHGAYVCLRGADGVDIRAAGSDITALARRLGLHNEFGGVPPARESIAFLRRLGGRAGDSTDDGVLHADWVVHVSSLHAEPVDDVCGELTRRLAPGAQVRVLRGVRRPMNYTGTAMNNWSYARAVVQRPGAAMPNAFLAPLSKTAAWWKKDWMERHTYFLPRYDDAGKIINDGHALAAEAGDYDFVSYFECAEEHVPVYHQVCDALRDVRRNPEWQFVREGPTWHGRRVASWEDLFA